MDADNLDRGIRLKPPRIPLVLNEDNFVKVEMEKPLPSSVELPLPLPKEVKTEELKFNVQKSRLTKLKNSEMYRYFLYLIAIVVTLYLTRKFWWKYVAKKFFPPEVEEVDFKSAEKDLTEEKVDFFDVSNVTEVVELSDKDALNVKKPATYAKVLLIYANWCGHCRDMMKAFEDAAKATHEKSKTAVNKVMFVRAEAGKVPRLANAPGIAGFPTIIGIFQNGKEFPYNGPRDVSSFMKFADLIAIGGLEPAPTVKPRTLPKRFPAVPAAPLPVETVDELDVPEPKVTFESPDDEMPSLEKDVSEEEVNELVKKTLESLDALKVKSESQLERLDDDASGVGLLSVEEEVVDKHEETETVEPVTPPKRESRKKVLEETLSSAKKTKKKELKL